MDTGKKQIRANGEGTIFKNRNQWTAAYFDIHGIRRTQSFKKRIVHVAIGRYWSSVSRLLHLSTTKNGWKSAGRTTKMLLSGLW